MKITKNQQKLRFKISDKIYSKGPISRIDISKETGITPATVSEITGYMIQDNLIHEIGEVVSDESKITIETVLKAYSLGDQGIINILNSAIRYLSITINNLSMLIDSNRIIVNGELFKEPLLSDLLKEYLNQNISLLSTGKKQNVIIKKYSNYNGALSASALAMSKLLIEVNENI